MMLAAKDRVKAGGRPGVNGEASEVKTGSARLIFAHSALVTQGEQGTIIADDSFSSLFLFSSTCVYYYYYYLFYLIIHFLFETIASG